MIERPEKFVRALEKSKERDDKRELNNRSTHTPPDAHSFLIVLRPSSPQGLITHYSRHQALGVDLVINNTPRTSICIPPSDGI